MLIKEIEGLKATGKHKLMESIDVESGEPIEVETFYDEKKQRSFEVDRKNKRYRESNLVGDYGTWHVESKSAL